MSRTKKRNGQVVRYPWDKWFSKNRFNKPQRLRYDVDFFAQPHSMGVMIRQQAAKRKLRVSIGIDIDRSLTLTVMR